jgi:hypothetical protein
VLPLDHFEGDAEVVEDGHGKIVKQNSCQLPVASSVLAAHYLIFEHEQLCPKEERLLVVVPY